MSPQFPDYEPVTNKERASRARAALEAYAALDGIEPLGILTLRDLLSDLMHWCDEDMLAKALALDFNRELHAARGHYDSEKGGAL